MRKVGLVLSVGLGLAIVESYEEHVSAAKARPEFDRMMRDAHRGMFDQSSL